jgi:hypothetical protein
MAKSATDVMQEIVFAAAIDAIAALKAASKGVPNTLLRDLNAIHANTTFADLPAELQAAIAASVRSAFTRLLREGYSVSSGGAGPPQRTPPRNIPPRGGAPRGGAPRRDHPDRPKGPRGGPRGRGPGPGKPR